MKALIIIGCGVLAACAAHKPADEPRHSSRTGATTVTMSKADEPDRTATRGEATPEHTSSTAGTRREGARSSQFSTVPGAATTKNPTRNTPETMETSETSAPPSNASGPAPDNTRVNERDRNGSTLTPMDQGNSDVDVMVTQQIRKAIVADSSLSFTAKNVKVITQSGQVTLRGVVKSEKERQAVEATARKIAGATNVDSQLDVKE